MTTDDKIKAITAVAITCIIITFAFLITIANYEQVSPVPVEEIPPGQSHYAVLYYVCGAMQHVLITTNPPIRAGIYQPLSQEPRDLLGATPNERVIELYYVGPECFYSEQPAPEKPIL